jgi:hypothetical protein
MQGAGRLHDMIWHEYLDTVASIHIYSVITANPLEAYRCQHAVEFPCPQILPLLN